MCYECESPQFVRALQKGLLKQWAAESQPEAGSIPTKAPFTFVHKLGCRLIVHVWLVLLQLTSAHGTAVGFCDKQGSTCVTVDGMLTRLEGSIRLPLHAYDA